MKNQTITIDADKTEAPAQLRHAWSEERAAAVAARRRGDQPGEWHHLERAHIPSQPMTVPHAVIRVIGRQLPTDMEHFSPGAPAIRPRLGAAGISGARYHESQLSPWP